MEYVIVSLVFVPFRLGSLIVLPFRVVLITNRSIAEVTE